VAKPPIIHIPTSELENRLDQIFREDHPPVRGVPPGVSRSQPLAELKKTVLSLDWEITPEAVEGFLSQVRLLKEVYPRDKTVAMLLKILGSLGQYIKSSRSKADPATFSLLNSVFARLEEITGAANMPEPTKRKLLQSEMDAYQKLREKIAQRRLGGDVKSVAAPQPTVAAPEGPASPAVTAQMLAQAVTDLKEFIRSEMAALRRQIKSGAAR
jgi:hypothetical protein